MRPHIWYYILPSEGGNDDISSCSRQRWDYLLPIMIHIGLLTKNENAKNGFDVQMTKSHFPHLQYQSTGAIFKNMKNHVLDLLFTQLPACSDSTNILRLTSFPRGSGALTEICPFAVWQKWLQSQAKASSESLPCETAN